MKLKDLEITLSQLRTFDKPKVNLEQYQTPPKIAAMLVWRAFELGDIENKLVADFCCGTGIFAIAASLLGAKMVWGYDIDDDALLIAEENAKITETKILWHKRDVRDIEKKFDTILMNGPFGIRTREKDREFLKAAILHGTVVYSIHLYLEENLRFLQRFVEKHRKKITEVTKAQFQIPHMYSFHTKTKHVIKVVIIRVE
ncbi:MAG: METTL5 family protein [Candidatus Heimdallarchaeaceae archaeon]